MTEKKQSVFQKLGIHLNVSRASSCFDSNGTNSKVMEALDEVKQQITLIKKEGAPVVPHFTAIAPKKPKEITEEYTRLRNEYDQRKTEHSELERNYNLYYSERYKTALLAFRFSKKLQNALSLIEKINNTETRESARQNAKETLVEVFDTLRNGGIGKGRSWELKFSEVYPEVPEEREKLAVLLEEVNRENKETNALFDRKEEISRGKLRFSEPVRTTVTYFVQESMLDITKCAIKNCKKRGKFSLSIEDFSNSVISSSPYACLYYGLPSSQTLQEYLNRKELYEEEQRDFKTVNAKKSKLYIGSFIEAEKKHQHMKVINGKKHWVGLNADKGVNFTTYAGKIFELSKDAIKAGKMRISSRAKEYMSNLIVQFLKSLSARFEIHKTHRTLVDPRKKNEKSIKFENVIEIFQLMLVNSDQLQVKQFIASGIEIRDRLKVLRNGNGNGNGHHL